MLGLLGTIAARGDLKASRMPALFLQVKRNKEFWEKEPDVRLGERVSFGKDPLLFQHYLGYGLQIQPLGNFGKANGLWTECKERPKDCKRRTLRGLLDSMLRVASTRGGSKAWEYWFPLGGGFPPWASGMAQATGLQALARASVYFAEPRYMSAAELALGLFLKPPPIGVRVHVKRGYHFLLYSFDSRLRVLNAFLQAITGLHDYAKLNDDRRARRLFRKGSVSFARSFRRGVTRKDLLGELDRLEARARKRLTAAMVGLLRSFTINTFDAGSETGKILLRTVNQAAMPERRVVHELREELRDVIAGLRDEIRLGSGQDKRQGSQQQQQPSVRVRLVLGGDQRGGEG